MPSADELDINRARNLLGPAGAAPLRAAAIAEAWFGRVVDRATVVSITTFGVLDDVSDEEEGLELASELSRRLEGTARELGIERVKIGPDI